jgi:delta-1-pyrroline-5-carboxylate synthetase
MSISRATLQTAAERIVVKVGSAILTDDEGRLSVPRMASIVEQIAQLRKQGKQVILVSSGSVACGRDGVYDEAKQDMNRVAAAVGQPILMSRYKDLFQIYNVKVGQVLVKKADFHDEATKGELRSLLLNLLKKGTVPILNTNDAIENLVMNDLNDEVMSLKQADMNDIILEDNDSLAAIISAEMNSDLLVMLSNVDGVYTGSPAERSSRLISNFTPDMSAGIEFGSKSNVGLGGMQAKVRSALWALKKGTSVVICNGSTPDIIKRVIRGERVGTFFTNGQAEVESADLVALARDGSRKLLSVGAEVRSQIINDIAQALKERKDEILVQNELDLVKARNERLESVLLARLKLTEDKLKSLGDGLRQIAAKSKNQVDRTIKRTKISDTLHLRQITSPIGVLLVIFESRPDCMPQISSLSIATANGLLLKGGKEAYHSNRCLYEIIKQVLSKYGCQDAVQLVDSRERVSELVNLNNLIDLIIPRGSNKLVKSIQEQAKTTPVLGHSEGICHVYIDRDANPDDAVKIAIDSKCNYPAACNAMETLLIHRELVKTDFFTKLCEEFKSKGVKVNVGSRLAKLLSLSNGSTTSNYGVEYGGLACTFEVVDSVDEAIDHINQYGSSHTDAIVTQNEEAATKFKKHVDSSSVFVNCSTRFADGYRFGLGAEVGISTSKIHARGPAGMDSLLTYKWVVDGSGDVVDEYEGHGCTKKYIHEEITTD